MWSSVTIILGLIALLVKSWAAKEPKRQEEERYEKEQAIRQALANGDADTVSRRIDELRNKANADRLSTRQQPNDQAPGRRSSPI